MKTYILLAPAAVDFGRLNNMVSTFENAEEMETTWDGFVTESICIAKEQGEEISVNDFELLTADDIAYQINNGDDCFSERWAKVVSIEVED